MLWAASLRHRLGWMLPHGYWVHAQYGTLGMSRFSQGFPVPVYGEWYTDMPATDGGWWYGEYRATKVLDMQLAAWVPVAVAGVVAAIPWRLDALERRRAGAGRCPKCRYDRAGLAMGAACPECGAPPVEAVSAA